jgi:hypothetical protein
MDFWFHFRVFERLGGATCERIRHPAFKGAFVLPIYPVETLYI